MVTCYIGIGSNLGERSAHIASAIEKLRLTEGVSRVRPSSLYETEPEGDIPQGRYLNGVLEVDTELPARELMERLLAIEASLGRVRRDRNAPRTIDLDILLYGDEVIAEEGLTVPHPRMHTRQFVLDPFREIAPDTVHPILKKRIQDIARC